MSRDVRPLKLPISRFNIPQTPPILAEYMADNGGPLPPRRRPSQGGRSSSAPERTQQPPREPPKQTQEHGQPSQDFGQSSRPAEPTVDHKSPLCPLNFLNLEDHENEISEPDTDEAREQSRRWRALNEQPWRHALRRISGVRKTSAAEGGPVNKTEAIEGDSDEDPKNPENSQYDQLSDLATQIYTVSYLIFFAIFGTLARLGLQALTFYPGAPVVFSDLWPNFAGSVFMGFLIEDRKLFREEWGTPNYHNAIKLAQEQERTPESGLTEPLVDLAAAKKAHGATKKTIPLYIGLATGFCGSFTTFSSFMRDCFLAISNDLPTPLNHPEDYSPVYASTSSTVHRNGGYSFMAVTAVILVTTALCMSGLFVGAHLALFITPITPSLPFRLTRRLLDPICGIVGWGCWLGAILMAIFPPDSSYSSHETWRGKCLFSIVFGPLGCLMRFYISLLLNPKNPSFPLGTFVVNVFGTMVLGMSWDLQHVPVGGMVGCQVLQGIEDGFCGCLTTVSTWVSELSTLKRWHAYRYGIITVFVSLASLIIIIGSLRWTRGFSELQCSH